MFIFNTFTFTKLIVNSRLLKGFLLITSSFLFIACNGDGDGDAPIGDGIVECSPTYFPPENSVRAPFYVDGRDIKDINGRTAIFRGINTSGDSKVPPFMPLSDDTMLDPLPDWGINVLRLLFTWEAYEPTRCNYEASYMDYYQQVVEWAEDRGLYVIVDFHQDAFSRFNIGGCGEGFPEWAVTSAVTKNSPINDESCEDWGTRMVFDLDHHKTWEHFHKDLEGQKTRYVEMVAQVAERMSQHRNVVGYELVNEPWGTDAELFAFYDAVGKSIRSRHPNTILFVPPHALVSSGGPANNIPKPNFDNFVYSPHYYDATVLLTGIWLGLDPSLALGKMKAKADEWNVPMLIGEYGAPAGATFVGDYMDAYIGWMDDHFISGTQWNYTPGWRDDIKDGWNHEDLSISDDNGNLRANFRPRPYAKYIAGSPISFTETSSSLAFTWQNDASLGSTELYIPDDFMQGKVLETSSGTSCQHSGVTLVCTASGNSLVQLSIE